MPAFSRDTLSSSPTADAVASACEPVAAWAMKPQRLLGLWGPGTPSCTHSPPTPWAAHRTYPGPPPARAVSLPAAPPSVAAARRFTERLLAEWGLHGLTADATLLLSELVTNAIVHVPGGAADVQLVISRTPDHLVAQVTDAGGCLPQCAEAGPDSENGRGIWLVEQIAAQWGHHASGTGTGKTVWFTLPLPGATPGD
ncbi:ATP-binding protein [Streptomyces sp. NPDC053079]|uniref:ATP-binding protein n=1 Tax=Streptomyces sp. NPDC053079 TaxID=3365697 RepID=UPI0037CF0C2A